MGEACSSASTAHPRSPVRDGLARFRRLAVRPTTRTGYTDRRASRPEAIPDVRSGAIVAAEAGSMPSYPGGDARATLFELITGQA
jgi:hypothetical protein